MLEIWEGCFIDPDTINGIVVVDDWDEKTRATNGYYRVRIYASPEKYYSKQFETEDEAILEARKVAKMVDDFIEQSQISDA